jgi:hypothetical protein
MDDINSEGIIQLPKRIDNKREYCDHIQKGWVWIKTSLGKINKIPVTDFMAFSRQQNGSTTSSIFTLKTFLFIASKHWKGVGVRQQFLFLVLSKNLLQTSSARSY